ncbi:MAG: anthranilate phosphoribosyltransferase [Parvibaculaceae bacterium]|nr:anthranilate phosphoribosyltransferase [Parvibaculaceae bacterium]
MGDFKRLIAKIADGKPLIASEATDAFEIIMSGEASAAQMGAFLMALHLRGETVAEITAGATVMRERALKVDAPADAIDIVGTGGDGHGTYNISTATALVVASGGVPVAKHGNRAASSRSGSSDVLQALGIRLDIAPGQISACIREAGVGFMFAAAHHAAMRYVAPVRSELGIRTIFNLLGPLSNPAGVKYQVLGVNAARWVEPFAQVLRNLGATRAMVVHGSDGLDEFTTTGISHVAELKDGNITSYEVTPEDAGLPRARLQYLKGGDPETNAAALTRLLEGEAGPYRDIVLLNAAAAFMVAGKVDTLKEGAALGAALIDSGAARATLARLIAVSNAVPDNQEAAHG